MQNIALLVRILHRAEKKTAANLRSIGERHKTDHEVYYLTRDIAGWSDRHVGLLADAGRRIGVNLDDDTATADDARPLRPVREKTAELMGQRPESGMLLLRDLRETHLELAELSVDWEILAQAAQGVKDRDLLALAQSCHPDALRGMRWANAMIKVVSPQVMAG